MVNIKIILLTLKSLILIPKTTSCGGIMFLTCPSISQRKSLRALHDVNAHTCIPKIIQIPFVFGIFSHLNLQLLPFIEYNLKQFTIIYSNGRSSKNQCGKKNELNLKCYHSNCRLKLSLLI